MNPGAYWKAIRRRWFDIVLAVVVALGAGWLITGIAPAGPPTRSYEATAVLVQTGNPFAVGNVSNLEAVAALSMIGDVPERVAAQLAYDDDPQNLVAQMKVTVVREAGVIRFTALTDDAERAAVLANAFATQARAFLRDQRTESIAQQSSRLSFQMDRLQADIEDLDEQLAEAPPESEGVVQAERDAKVRQYGLVYEQFTTLALAQRAPEGLELVSATGAVPQSSGGLDPPRSRASRLIIAGILGLISGIIIVLIADRFDARIRTREGAEKAFGLPLLAEIPFLPRRKRKAIVTESEPRSHAADAFRIVTAMLSMAPSPGSSNGGGGSKAGNGRGTIGIPPPPDSEASRPEPPRTILVTSPGPDDGKTTVVANLAATFAARDQRTLVLSCDLRRPFIHRLLRAPNERGLAEALGNGDGSGDPLHLPVEKTSLPNVQLLPSGQPPADPGEILASTKMLRTIHAARRQSDIVIIDTAPILTTSDPIPLIREVDAVVVVARCGRTTIETAKRAAELLRRLEAPTVGVVLNAAAEINLPRRYYSSRYYRKVKRSRWRRGKPRLPRPPKKEYAPKW